MSFFNVDEIIDVLIFLDKIHSKIVFNKFSMGANVVKKEWKMNEWYMKDVKLMDKKKMNDVAILC